ncbi:MAG TPA: hypothetical protein VGK48_07440 [Terriglobia bacterium]|jgi:hypothetical protein
MDNPAERAAGAGEVHLHGGNRAALQRGDLGDREILNIEEFDEPPFRIRKLCQGEANEIDPPAPVNFGFELRHAAGESFVEVVESFARAAAPPVVADGVVNDFSQELLSDA